MLIQKTKLFSLLLLIDLILKIFSKIIPGDYLEYDNNFEDENINQFERYHHIIAAWSSSYPYIDEYSGIYYSSLRCSYINYYTYLTSGTEILTKLLPEYKEKTRLLGLITKGCANNSESYFRTNNFPVFILREDANISYSAIFRLANTYEWDLNITIGACNGTSITSGCVNKTGENIPSQGFIKYHIKWDEKYIYFKGEFDDNFDKRTSKLSTSGYIVIYNIDPKPEDALPLIFITSVLLRAEMFKYKLTISGNRMNFCYNLGCMNSGYYQCSTSYGSGATSFCSNTYGKETCNLRGCVPGAYCDTTNNLYLCKECDFRCRTCFNMGSSSCMSCYNTAIAPQWYSYTQSSTSFNCTYEYIAFNKFNNFEVEIPLLLNYRATVEFWIFIVNPKTMTDSNLQTSFSSFIFKQFFTIVISHNLIDISNVDVMLIPFENIYPFNKNIINDITFSNYYELRYTTYQKVTKTFERITSRWFYVRVGISYTHKKMYVNDNEVNLNYPKFYFNEDTTYQSYMRTFFRKNEKGILRVQGFQYVNTDIYIRNFNCYSDYLNININNPNIYNMHNLDLISVPELLFVIPFNDIIIDTNSVKSTFSLYDYSNQFTYDSTLNNQVLKTTITFEIIPTNLSPSKNFRRIKFLNGAENKYYKNTNLDTTGNLVCTSTTNGNRYCYEDNTPFACKEYYNLFVSIDYTNIISLPGEEEEYQKEVKCTRSCKYLNKENNGDIEFMRLPNIKINQNTNLPISTDICNYECDSNVNFCPSNSDSNTINSKDYLQRFQCKENYITLFYQCLNEEEFNFENSGLQFSKTYKTKSIYFPLIKDTENPISNYMIEMWFHPDLLTQNNPPLENQYIFMSDSSAIYFDYYSQKYKLKTITDNFISINELGFNIYYYGWNHLIIISKSTIINGLTYTEFNVSIANSFVNVDLVSGINTISKICFCNYDENCCGSDIIVKWLDMFIKDIKLWDARFIGIYSLYDFDKFSYIIPGGLIHWYKLDVKNINNDIIKCQIDNTYKAIFPYDNYFLNPYDDQNYNYGFNFNWNDINYPYYISNTLIISEKSVVNITDKGTCYEGCLKCFGNSKHNCFKCNENYALNGATCTLNSHFDSYFYYINPLHKSNNIYENDDELELDFSTLNLNNYPSLTIFFYMKLYGFTNEQINQFKIDNNPIFDIVYFSNDNSFKLSYDVNDESLKLIIDNEIQFKFNKFSKKMATWIPISIGAFRAFDISLQKHFASMTIETTPLEYLFSDYTNKIYKKFNFETFKISKNMIGHISDVTLFKSLIINALGYATHKDNPNSIFSELNPNGLNLIIKSFPLKYKKEPIKRYDINNNIIGIESWPNVNLHCLDETLYKENINNNIKNRASCVEDYITYTDQNCDDLQYVKFNTQNYPPTCFNDASKCENINQVLINMINCDYLYATCDNWSVNSIKNLIFLYEKSTYLNYIICGKANGLDIARFKENSIPNIKSPQEKFKMEFWFLTQSYVNNNFRELIINWNNHIKIIITYDPISNKYSGKCIGLNSIDNEVSFFYSSSNVKDNIWRYVVCGIDIPNNEIYITNLQKENQGLNYKKNLITINIPSADLTTLTISENSPTNFGVTYINELRLWECYDCSSDRAFVFFNRDDIFFDKVLHYFKFEDPTGLLKDYKNNIYTGDENIKIQFETKDDFNGYGLLNEIPEAPNCNEGGSLYYSLKMGEGCDILFNFNVFKNDIIFNNIPSSRNNRYTIEFWFYVESSDDFTKGFNIIFEDHISISTYSKNKNERDLSVYCFPQAYRNNLFNSFGDEILNKFNIAQNKAGYTFVDGYSKWNYVRCGYSYDLQKYYINNENEIDVKSEIFFSNPNLKQNEKSFKMFMKNLVRLIINVSRDNFVRIFFQTLNIYRDYIPQTIETKYIRMKEYITSISKNYYYPLLFAVDFPEDYNIITNTLKYKITDYDYIPTTEQIITDFMTDIYSHSYSTYPIYDKFLQCGIGKIYKLDLNGIPYCDFITEPDNCNSYNVFCLDNNKYFWCPENKYLDINLLICNDDCPSDYTRPSDIIKGYGMCYIKGSDLHYSTFPYLNNDLLIGNYENKFECESGYQLVNYHCVSQISDSAIYFSNKYSFTNTIASFNRFNIKNYYIDFWIMFDMTETYRYSNLESDINQYYIFIAFPHIITRYKNNIQYTNGYVINKVTNITTIDKLLYKWNHITIENYFIEGENLASSFKYVNIYINNNYEEPSMSLKINNDNDFSLCQIAFCNGKNDNWANCVLGLNSGNYKVYQNIIWEDAFYKKITVWNAESTGISSINTFGTPLNNELTMNIVAYYPFSIDTIGIGKITSNLLYNGNNVDFNFIYNTENEYDHSTQINWVNNFDITLPNKYIISIDNSNYINKDISPYFTLESNSYIVDTCSNNCYQCFTFGSDNCINCQNGYLLEGTKCISPNNYYFKTPVNNNLNDPIQFNFDFSSYDEVTFMIFMKFMGSVNLREGIVPLIYFYNNDNYIGWDNDNNQFIINYKSNDENKILFKYDNSRLSMGKWSLFSLSISHTKIEGIFPNMIQFMIDNLSLSPNIDFDILKNEKILYNKISLSNIVSSLYYDLRIYNKFFIGSYSLGQEYDTSREPHLTYLKKRILLNSNSIGINCLDSSEVNVNLGINNYCIGDVNIYDDINYFCNSDLNNEKFRIIDSITQSSKCENCNSNCISKCYDNDIKGCMCSYDSEKYLLRYIKSAKINEGEKMFYCQNPEGLNLNEFNNININNIAIGQLNSYMIEFWIYIYSYMQNSNFKGGSIEWIHFIKIDINSNSNDDNYIDIICYPCSDEINYNIKEELIHKIGEWIFIRCIVDKENLYITLNEQKNQLTSQIIETINQRQPKTGKTNLILKDNNLIEPYGLFLIREIRIWDTKTNLFYDTSHLNLAIDSTYQNLVHYFKINYENNSDRKYIFDNKNNRNITLNDPIISPYPYSYIPESYIDLILCNEGENYKYNEIKKIYECSLYESDDILSSIKKDNSILSPSDLLSKMELIYEMAINEYISPLNSNDILFTEISINKNNEFEFKDPEISSEYCSNNGYVRIVDHTPTCYCYGDYTGKYCQIYLKDYSNIYEIYSLFFEKTKETFKKYKDNNEGMKKIILSLSYLLKGIEYFSHESSLLIEIVDWFNSIIYTIQECDIEYIKLIDILYSNNMNLINYYKIGNMVNGKGNSRNSELSFGQQSIVDTNSIQTKRMFEYLSSLCFSKTVNNEWNYKSNNLNIDLIQINSNFNIDSYLKNKKEKLYEPYFQIGNCLNEVKKSTSGTLNLQFITWYNSPYYWNPDLYWNYTSHYIQIKIYNQEYNEVPINECTNKNKIEFYLTLFNPFMVDILNKNKWNFYRENMHSSNESIFTNPKYIDSKGNIEHSTREERINKYYYQYILQFNTLNGKNLSYTNEGLEYNNITELNYFKCSSNHLSEFMLNYLYNPYPTKEDGRFFFLTHFSLYKNFSNYKKNYGFFVLVIILILYFTNLIFCKIRNINKLKALENIRYKFINIFLLKYVYPYGNTEIDYVVNKDTGNKIYNEDYEKIDEKTISQQSEKDDALSINKLKNRNQKKTKKRNLLSKNFNINLGNVKSRKLYSNYFSKMKSNDDTLSKNYDKNQDEITESFEGKIEIKKNTNDFNEENLSIEHQDTNIQLKSNKKKNIKRNNFYMSNEDLIKNNMKNLKSNKDKDYIHNLYISNENQRTKNYIFMKVSAFNFFITNFLNRNIFINTWNSNATYTAMTKALYLPLYLLIMLFINTFIYVFEKEELSIKEYLKLYKTKFFLFSCLSIILTNMYFYLKACFYNIENGQVRTLLYDFKTKRNKFDTDYRKILKKIKNVVIFETILFFLFWILNFFFAFGLCCVYYKQGKIMILSFIIGIAIDFILDIIVELLIMVFYILRENTLFVIMLDKTNRIRSFKMLSP